jgi:hypothetical protein
MDRKGLSTPPPAIRNEEFISLASAVNNSTIDSTTMGRIVILSSDDLSRSFRTALNTLAEAGIQMRPGTKLLTRYAVVVVDETAIDGGNQGSEGPPLMDRAARQLRIAESFSARAPVPPVFANPVRRK